jgi:hypothetical protein
VPKAHIPPCRDDKWIGSTLPTPDRCSRCRLRRTLGRPRRSMQDRPAERGTRPRHCDRGQQGPLSGPERVIPGSLMGCPLVDEFLLRVTTAHHRSSIRPARPCSATWSEPGSLTARPTSEPAPLCPFPPRHHGCRRQADRRTGRGDMASGRRPPARIPTAGLPGGDGHLRPHSELWDDGARRALNYTEFFDRRDDLLTDDGLMLHHTIGSNESTQSIDAWLDRYVSGLSHGSVRLSCHPPHTPRLGEP